MPMLSDRQRRFVEEYLIDLKARRAAVRTGQSSGQRHIWGGRSRPRRMLYLAAIVAKRIDPAHKAFALRLTKAGKKPKVVIVAVMRKIIEAANLVLGRGTPWVPTSPA